MISIVTLLFEFVILAVFKSTGTTDVGNFLAAILIMIHTLVTIGTLNKNRKLKSLSKYLVFAYLLRLLFLSIDLFTYPRIALPDGHADEDMFKRGFYPKLMGTLFRFIGTNRFFGQYVSMLPSIVALAFLAFSLYELQINGSVRKRVFGTVCLMPYNAILSSLFIREAFMYMFLSMSYYHIVLWTKSKKEREYFVAAGLVLPAALFHSGTIAVLIGYIVIRLIYDNKRETVEITIKNVFAAIVVASLTAFVLSQSGSSFLGKFSSLDSIEEIANTYDFAASSYTRYVGNSDSIINFILYSPLRLFFFVFSPVPFLWRGASDVIAFTFSTMIYVAAIWNVIKYLGLKTESKHNKVRVIIISFVALAILFVFSWGTSNAGTALRHRDKTLVLFAILWALSLDGRQVGDASLRRRTGRKYS